MLIIIPVHQGVLEGWWLQSCQQSFLPPHSTPQCTWMLLTSLLFFHKVPTVLEVHYGCLFVCFVLSLCSILWFCYYYFVSKPLKISCWALKSQNHLFTPLKPPLLNARSIHSHSTSWGSVLKKAASFTLNSPTGLALQMIPVHYDKFQSVHIEPDSTPFPEALRTLVSKFHQPWG